MKITIYTIKDCAFSKQEKEYLNTNKLVFEEKDLEINKEFLTEMLAISNNFAGTPVTRVEKDDGTIAVLKGFTKEEFDTTFGLAPIPPVAEVPPAPTETVSPAPIATETPTIPITEPPVSEPSNQVTNNQATISPDPLKSVMDNLQSQSTVPTPPAPVVEQPPVIETPPVMPPVIPEPTNQVTNNQTTDSAVPPAGAPSIPDFPAK